MDEKEIGKRAVQCYEEAQKLLNEAIKNFYEDKQLFDKYKKETEKENTDIKQLMADLQFDSFVTDNGLTAKLSVQKRESFNEENLIAKLKELGIEKPIKTVEVIDYEVLEDVIYNGLLDAAKIADCKQIKETLMLKVSEKKGK